MFVPTDLVSPELLAMLFSLSAMPCGVENYQSRPLKFSDYSLAAATSAFKSKDSDY